jgi:hypothetical protein
VPFFQSRWILMNDDLGPRKGGADRGLYLVGDFVGPQQSQLAIQFHMQLDEGLQA